MNPFEIRLKLLELSQSILSEEMWAERNRLENDWSVAKERAVENKTELPSYPSMPSLSEDAIIAKAKKLNEFISNTGVDKND